MNQKMNHELMDRDMKFKGNMNNLEQHNLAFTGLIKNKPIFTSQKEINETKASNIPVKIYKNTCSSKQEVPVIMLKNKKGEYMVVDGHHRWLAHYLKNANLKIVELNTNSYGTK